MKDSFVATIDLRISTTQSVNCCDRFTLNSAALNLRFLLVYLTASLSGDEVTALSNFCTKEEAERRDKPIHRKHIVVITIVITIVMVYSARQIVRR